MTKPDEHYRAILESMTYDGALDYVCARVKEAIEDIRRTRVKVERALDRMLSSR
jgi:hypothetical protein